MVGLVVVVSVEEGEVVEVGGASVCPVDDVVGVGPSGGAAASRCGAATVAGDEGSAYGGGDAAGLLPYVYGGAQVVGDNRGESGVAGQSAGGVGGDHPGLCEFTWFPGASLEGVYRDGECHMGPFAARHRGVTLI